MINVKTHDCSGSHMASPSTLLCPDGVHYSGDLLHVAKTLLLIQSNNIKQSGAGIQLRSHGALIYCLIALTLLSRSVGARTSSTHRVRQGIHPVMVISTLHTHTNAIYFYTHL